MAGHEALAHAVHQDQDVLVGEPADRGHLAGAPGAAVHHRARHALQHLADAGRLKLLDALGFNDRHLAGIIEALDRREGRKNRDRLQHRHAIPDRFLCCVLRKNRIGKRDKRRRGKHPKKVPSHPRAPLLMSPNTQA
jgi:hypothetical protein